MATWRALISARSALIGEISPLMKAVRGCLFAMRARDTASRSASRNFFARARASGVHRMALLSLVFGVVLAAPASAYDLYVDAKVGIIETNYMPGWIAFTITNTGGTCAADAFLNHNAQGATSSDKQANVSAVLAALLTAQATNRAARFYGNNSGCVVTNIWLFDS
mgnify:CR=1 FL=1